MKITELMKSLSGMKQKLEELQERLSNITVEGTSGGGVVKVTANCRQELLDVKFDPSLFDPPDRELIEDLVIAAVNDALKKSTTKAAEQFSSIAGGIDPSILKGLL